MNRSLADWRLAVEHAWDHREFEGEEVSELLDEIEKLRVQARHPSLLPGDLAEIQAMLKQPPKEGHVRMFSGDLALRLLSEIERLTEIAKRYGAG